MIKKKDLEALLEIIDFYLEYYATESDYTSKWAIKKYDELWGILHPVVKAKSDNNKQKEKS
jgi:hypothetical protein